MKAIVCTGYGPPEVLQLREVETPVPKKNEIRVKIYATAVNSGDWRLRKPDPAAVRLFFGLTKPRKPVLGSVFAGVVDKTGPQATAYQVGDRVFGMTGMAMGAYAEYVCVPETGCVATMPASLDFDQAASVPFGATTALHFLQKAGVRKGAKVLIYGASGAVGTAAVQLAKSYEAEVTGVCSAANAALVRSLGADRVLDYAADDFANHRETYDVVLETVNKLPLKRCLSLLEPNGTLLLIAADFATMLKGAWAGKTGQSRVMFGPAAEKSEYLQHVKLLIETGRYAAVIDRSYPLERIVEAHRYGEQGRKKGNVVIRIE